VKRHFVSIIRRHSRAFGDQTKPAVWQRYWQQLAIFAAPGAQLGGSSPVEVAAPNPDRRSRQEGSQPGDDNLKMPIVERGAQTQKSGKRRQNLLEKR
jgi:hypothetical protein